MRRLYRFLTLEPVERRLLVEAAFLLSVIRLALGRVPFTTLRRMVVRGPRKGIGPPNPGIADQVVWAVNALFPTTPRRATCLVRALAVQAMLARRGYPSRLRIGVMRGSPGGLDGHAWVEHEGRILIGGSAPELARFAPITAFDSDAVMPLGAHGEQ